MCGKTFAYIYSNCQTEEDSVDTTHTCHFHDCMHSYSIQEWLLISTLNLTLFSSINSYSVKIE
jgi:hypothetical protein